MKGKNIKSIKENYVLSWEMKVAEDTIHVLRFVNCCRLLSLLNMRTKEPRQTLQSNDLKRLL